MYTTQSPGESFLSACRVRDRTQDHQSKTRSEAMVRRSTNHHTPPRSRTASTPIVPTCRTLCGTLRVIGIVPRRYSCLGIDTEHAHTPPSPVRSHTGPCAASLAGSCTEPICTARVRAASCTRSFGPRRGGGRARVPMLDASLPRIPLLAVCS